MKKYAILILPAMNKVYYKASIELAKAELSVMNLQICDGAIEYISEEVIAGIPYITFQHPQLQETHLFYMSHLSFIYALFEIQNELLKPLSISPTVYFEDDLISIQKYSGKTNEYFTKLLLNAAILSSNFKTEWTKKLHVLDPMCGKGTSLHLALQNGWNATGVEIDKKAFDAYEIFIKTYLKEKRLKHKFNNERIRENKKVKGYKFSVEVANNKLDYKEGNTLNLTVYNEDTKNIGSYFRAGTFHSLIVDLPYGVQHGSSSRTGSFTRNPIFLLEEVLPGWKKVLKTGGTMGIAWNVNVLSRKALTDVLTAHGLEVLSSDAYLQFEHRVDQAVIRDFVIAIKNS